MKKEKTTGHTAMLKWNSTWRHHHLPVWFKKAVRAACAKDGTWRPGNQVDEKLPPLFDHVGSIELATAAERAVVAQPYGDHDSAAKAYAKRLGCELHIYAKGAWHPKTKCYIFVSADPIKIPFVLHAHVTIRVEATTKKEAYALAAQKMGDLAFDATDVTALSVDFAAFQAKPKEWQDRVRALVA